MDKPLRLFATQYANKLYNALDEIARDIVDQLYDEGYITVKSGVVKVL